MKFKFLVKPRETHSTPWRKGGANLKFLHPGRQVEFNVQGH